MGNDKRDLACTLTETMEQPLHNRVIVGQIRECLYRVVSDIEEGIVSKDLIEERVQAIYACMIHMRHILPEFNAESVDLVQSVLLALTDENDVEKEAHLHACEGQVGRPRYHISKAQLEWFVETGFSGSRIAMMLGVSEATIRRRLREFGIQCGQKFSSLTNEELDGLVKDIVQENPHCGIRMLHGILLGIGHSIQRNRLQESMRRVDPIGVQLRGLMLNVIKRRTYNVPGPQALWHIDGNHKLIRWRLVVHGGIDGFSRLIVYLGCADNNKAKTVFKLFEAATMKFGIPRTVRSDKGGENVDVARFMLSQPARGHGHSNMITGPSTHNQRIERLWRDVFVGVLHLYHTIFTHLENRGQLDACSDVDLFCLHYVFLPRINKHLDLFKHGWNNHKLRSVGGSSPQQLWVEGMVHGIRNTQIEEDDTYGIDFDGPVAVPSPDEAACQTIDVPRTSVLLDNNILQELEDAVDPLELSDSYGMDIYERTQLFVRNHLQQH